METSLAFCVSVVTAIGLALPIFADVASAEDKSTAHEASQKWSKTANGLSGRLLVALEDLKPGLRHAVTLELKNVSTEALAVIDQPQFVEVQLLDERGNSVRKRGYDMTGDIPFPQWGVIPREAYLGFRVDMRTVGLMGRPPHRIALIAVGGQAWFLAPGKYTLRAKLVAKKQEGPDNQWLGSLDLPPVDFTFK